MARPTVISADEFDAFVKQVEDKFIELEGKFPPPPPPTPEPTPSPDYDIVIPAGSSWDSIKAALGNPSLRNIGFAPHTYRAPELMTVPEGKTLTCTDPSRRVVFDFRDTTGNGITVRGGVTLNRISARHARTAGGATGAGFSIQRVGNVLLNNCEARGNQRNGMWVFDSRGDVTIRGGIAINNWDSSTTPSRSDGDNIKLEECKQGTLIVDGTRVEGRCDDGIDTWNSTTTIIIRDVEAVDIGDSGIRVGAAFKIVTPGARLIRCKSRGSVLRGLHLSSGVIMDDCEILDGGLFMSSPPSRFNRGRFLGNVVRPENVVFSDTIRS
jgi:hypothetical protein